MSLSPDASRAVHDQRREIAKMLVEQHESDRGCVMFCAAWLEDELELLIRAYCRKEPSALKTAVDPLFKGYAPLSTFAAKIQVSYALGFISKHLHKALQLVRKLRNDFAHEKSGVSFQSPKYRSQFENIISSVSREESKNKAEDDRDSDSQKVPQLGMTKGQLIDRLAFCLAVTTMIGHIKGRQQVVALLRKDKTVLTDETDTRDLGYKKPS